MRHVSEKEPPNVEKTFSGTNPEDFRILLAHQPKTGSLTKEKFDLQLSGHTHGGHIFFMYLILAYFNDGLVSGFYDRGARKVYVTNGSGLLERLHDARWRPFRNYIHNFGMMTTRDFGGLKLTDGDLTRKLSKFFIVSGKLGEAPVSNAESSLEAAPSFSKRRSLSAFRVVSAVSGIGVVLFRSKP